MVRLRPLAWALALIALPASAAAETPTPPAPDQPAPPQPQAPAAQPAAPPSQYAPPPQYPQPPPQYPVQPGYPPQGYPPPGYGQPQPGYGYGQPYYGQPYYVPQGPPPPPPPKPANLRWSLRFDPFELLMRRMTFQAEVAIAGPFAIEVAPSWIFGSPYSGIDEKGFTIAGNAVFYLSGQPFRGLWLKAHFAYENFSATYANPYDPTLVGQPQRFGSAILGALFGDTFVVPKSGGFALSGGIGIGVATAPKATLTSGSDARFGPVTATLYDGFDRVRILGMLGLGVAF